MKKDFWPVRENDQVLFLDKLSIQLAQHQAALASAVSAGDVTTARNIYLWFAWAVLQVAIFEGERKQRVTFKNTLRDNPAGESAASVPELGTTTLPAGSPPAPGFLAWLRELVARIKVHAAYTETIGQDLGIVPSSAAVPTKPVGAASALAGCRSRVTYFKSKYSGVKTESQRNSETVWENLGARIRSEFIDDRAPLVPGQPETRRYRLTYLNGDTPVGEPSDIISVTVAP